MTERHCTHCQSTELEEGLVWHQPGRGAYDNGTGTWYSGANEPGVFGGLAKKNKRRRAMITAHRCSACGHLEWFSKLEEPPTY